MHGNLFAHTVAVIRLHLSKKEQTIAYIYIIKTYPTMIFQFFKIIIVCIHVSLVVCLFGILSSYSREFFHSYRDVTITDEGLNFYLCLALMSIEQWGYFSVPHLLWHGASIYNGQLRGPVTLTPIPQRLAVELSISVFTNYVCRGWDSSTQPSACGANALIHCVTASIKELKT